MVAVVAAAEEPVVAANVLGVVAAVGQDGEGVRDELAVAVAGNGSSSMPASTRPLV